ncbi:isopeptide-forming domain-containing fimbrial protein [Streptomyces sp. NPDC090025]|uniref:isopeptide-forming domain-containing fimbrial protein n=1 Tax=Streptomyces sp. NPDC090025 TaxID=3365922 RepID=UPI0038348C0C
MRFMRFTFKRFTFTRFRTPGILLATLGLAAGALSLTGAGPAAADVVEPFGKRYDESLYGDFITIGNTVIGCPTAPADMAARCKTAGSGQGSDNNNTFDMRRIDTAGMGGDLGSSTGKVEIPPGATVVYARLFWGGNDGTYRGPSGAQLARCDISGADVSPSPGDHATTAPKIKVGAGAVTPVSIDHMVTDPATTGGPHYYTGESDVTAAFAAASGDTPVAVGGVWAPSGRGCVAGWSLTVVYRFPGPNATYAPERRNVYVYGGHVLQRSTSPATTVTVDGFYRTQGIPRAGVTAYEGDWNTPGDRFLVDGQNVVQPHTGNTRNFFISASDGAVDPDLVNNLSIDAEEFDLPDAAIPVGATSAELTFSTKGDTYVPSALALSVPVPDLVVTKKASPQKVKPGDTVTYTVTAENISGLDYPGARFSDDLTGNLDDGKYLADAKTDLGKVTWTSPKITYAGDIPAGKKATITYSVKIDDPVKGDGKLPNSVEVQSPRSNCGPTSEDPACGVAPVLSPPTHPSPPTSPDPSPSSPGPSASHPGTPSDPPSDPTPSTGPHPGGPGDGSHPGGDGGDGGEMAETGSNGERLWLLGALAAALVATGLVARAAVRSRRRQEY